MCGVEDEHTRLKVGKQKRVNIVDHLWLLMVQQDSGDMHLSKSVIGPVTGARLSLIVRLHDCQ
jgi:hypothetical protein